MSDSILFGIETMGCVASGNLWNRLDQLRRQLLGMKYTYDTASIYLDTIYRIGCILVVLEKTDDFEQLLNHLEGIIDLIPETKEDAIIVRLSLIDLQKHDKRELFGRIDIIKQICEYAIRREKPFLLARRLNDLGNYYSNCFHNDLATVAYLLSASIIYKRRKECTQEQYRVQLMYPFSNLISTMGEWNNYLPIKKQLFEQEILDLSVRSFFAEALSSNYLNDDTLDSSLFDTIKTRFYGIEKWESFIDTVIRLYGDERDRLTEYIAQNSEKVSRRDLLLAEIWDEGVEGLSKATKSMDSDFFFQNIDLVVLYYEQLSREDKDSLLSLMLENVRNRKAQMSFDSAQVLFDDLLSGKALYSPKRVGRILLEHAGDNGVYDEALSIFSMIKDYQGFPEGNKWIKDAIDIIGLSPEIGNDFYDSILDSLNKHCSHIPYYLKLIDNLYLVRTFLSGKPRVELNDSLLCRIDDPKRLRVLRSDNNNRSGKPSEDDSFDCSNILDNLFRTYSADKNGVAHQLFVEDIVYSTQQISDKNNPSIDQSVISRAVGVRKELQDSEVYQKLKAAFISSGWKVDESNLYLNCLAVSKNEESAVLYLFNETENNAWLADEESFMGEDPRWFSERSHTVSPVFLIRQHSSSEDDVVIKKVVVLMSPIWVINAEDIQKMESDPWNGVVVIKSATLLESLFSSQSIPNMTDFKDLGISEQTVKTDFSWDSESNMNLQIAKSKEDQNDDKKKTALENKHYSQEQIKREFSSPWNLVLLYKHHSKPYYGKEEDKYKPEYSILRVVLDAMGPKLIDTVFIEWAEIILYFYTMPLKFRMRAHFEDGVCILDPLNETKSDPFVVEPYVDDELKIDTINGSDSIDSVSVVEGDIATDECAIVYRFCPDDSYRQLDLEHQLECRKAVSSYFRDVLTDEALVGSREDWRRAISRVSRALLSDRIRQLAEQTAKTAIMSRNMSHNLGSHVMAYLKRDLFSVGDILNKGVLQEFYPFSEDLKEDAPQSIEDFLRILEDRNKEIEMPFLVGLGRFISYLQERQDFIATVATVYTPYYSVVNFKDDIYDTLNPDYRYYRHMDRRGGRPDNLLMKYIALSEGLTRGGKVSNCNNKNDIVIKFRSFDGINDYRNQKNRGRTEARGEGAKDLEAMREFAFSLPGGIVGRQAIFSILENLIRNAAKHGRREKDKENLEFTFDIHRGETLATDERSKDLYEYLSQDPDWKGAFCLESSLLNRYLLLTITDNLCTTDSDYESLCKAIKEPYVDENAVFIDNHKGIKEIRICAAWIRGIDNDLQIKPNEPPVVTVRRVDGHLQYIFCVYLPVRVTAVSDEHRAELEYISKGWKDWRIMSSEEFLRIKHKSSDVILVDGDDIMYRLIPFAPDRLVPMDFDVLTDEDCNPREEEEVYAKLVSQAYNVDLEDDYPVLIVDGKTQEPISSHVHLVADDANVTEPYYFAYRSHHQFEGEFKTYMEGSLCKSMLGIEGITGGNSTDRLVRSERLDDVWYAKHLCALRTRVAIFDERLFSKVTGLDDAQLLAIEDGAWMKASRDAMVHVQKRTWVFNVIARPDQNGFDVYGYCGFLKDEEGNYFSRIERVAHIGIKRINILGVEGLPCIDIQQGNSGLYYGYFDYISIHQGLMDKCYDYLKLKSSETYPKELRNNTKELKKIMDLTKCGVSTAFYKFYKEGEILPVTPSIETLISFKRGLFIHSGRSKPSEHDMPQKLPFIQYAAIENAVYDCKYTLVELMKSALYE